MPPRPPTIDIQGLQVTAGAFRLGPIDLRVEAGEYAVLAGPTGSGKTTLLEALAGLRPINAGQVFFGNMDVTARRPADRSIGYVPQDGALFSTMSVHANLAFGLRARGVARRAALAKATKMAEQLAVAPLLNRMPRNLSGGERQRVALGRALATRPDVLLLDEPFSSIDAATRTSLYQVLQEFRSTHCATTLHVSHHEEDAAALADRVLSMDAGRVV